MSAIAEFWEAAPHLFEVLQQAGAVLAVSEIVPSEVESALHALVDALLDEPESLGGADPNLVSALYASAMRGLDALREEDPHKKRRELRGPLERIRQALRDLIANEPVMDDKTMKQVVDWLVHSDEIPVADLAGVLGVPTNRLRRWADVTDTAPRGAETRRVRILAKVVNQLRWSFTPVGVVEWLELPHPALKGHSPKTLLDSPEGGLTLLRLAASTRSMTLT